MSGRHTGQLDDASRREPATGEAGRCKSGLRVGVTHAWASRGYGSNVKDRRPPPKGRGTDNN